MDNVITMMCSICIRRFGCNFKGGLFDPRFGGLGGTWGSGMGPFDSFVERQKKKLFIK